MVTNHNEAPRVILMHPVLVPAFDRWLASRGLECRCVGVIGDDANDLPSWIITPTDEAIRRVVHE